MFVEFGDFVLDVDRIIGLQWQYKMGIVENALGLSTKAKTDELIGVTVMLDTAMHISVEDKETAQLIWEWYERNRSQAGLHAQSTTHDIH